MKNNYTVFFICLFIVSIAGGFALKNVFEYSVLIGISLGVIFLLCAAFFVGKFQKNQIHNNHIAVGVFNLSNYSFEI